MGWVRLDDNLHDHPKFLELGLAATELWTLCRTWAARHPRTIDGRRTAGVVTPGAVRRFAGPDGVDLASQLVDADLWSPVDEGWELVDTLSRPPVCTGRTALYRLFDAGGRLLYVGVTAYPPARFSAHARTKAWWPEVADSTVQWLDLRADALEAETAAIRSELPLFNIAGARATGGR